MNRDIEFRAWATKKKQMVDLKKITPLALADGMLTSKRDGLFLPFRDDIILMQYTGLKDKNGKKIYEGDIVRCWDNAADDSRWGLDRAHTGIVEYTTGCYSLKITAEQGSDNLFLSGWVNAENIEVLGNVYENPELIQQPATA